MNRTAIDATVEAILAALARGEAVAAVPLTFLLRCYGATDRADLRDALEPALADALDRHACARTVPEQSAWLVLFADALSVSADERLSQVVTRLMGEVRRDWGRSSDIVPAAASIEACLRAARSLGAPAVVADAVDELERVAGAAYRPGRGVTAGEAEAEPRLADQVTMASALLMAYHVTGRLPYAMLAEELMHGALRRFWNPQAGRFVEPVLDGHDAARVNADAARALAGVADLHEDAHYRSTAVIRGDAAYREIALRIVAAHEPGPLDAGSCSAAYGLALLDLGSKPDTAGACE